MGNDQPLQTGIVVEKPPHHVRLRRRITPLQEDPECGRLGERFQSGQRLDDGGVGGGIPLVYEMPKYRR